MRAWLDLSPIADMPLAVLVERICVACLVDSLRIELCCDLPCKPFRLHPDAPLAHLIGVQLFVAQIIKREADARE